MGSYEPTDTIWAVGRHQGLAAKAIQHKTNYLAHVGLDHLKEFPDTPRLLDPATRIVYRDNSRRVCDAAGCRFVEHRWQCLKTTYDLGYGDCKCLVAIRLAECWRDGRDAYALARCYECRTDKSAACPTCQKPVGSGGQTWHMQLVHADGRIEDISRWLGMPSHHHGDDAVVAPEDQVGIVRLPPLPGTATGGSVIGPAIATVIATTPVDEVATVAISRWGRKLPAWIRDLVKPAPRVDSAAQVARAAGASFVCKPTDKSPNPLGGNPVPGLATAIDYPWCVPVRHGDTVRNIAERITGDPSRYLEIIAANPKKPTITLANGELDFAPETLIVHERLTVPDSMKRWVGQDGRVAGREGPFPASGVP